jgi:hypothetical protein
VRVCGAFWSAIVCVTPSLQTSVTGQPPFELTDNGIV